MANPIVPLLALVSSYIEIRGDGFKLLKIHRRPEPVGVEVTRCTPCVDKADSIYPRRIMPTCM